MVGGPGGDGTEMPQSTATAPGANYAATREGAHVLIKLILLAGIALFGVLAMRGTQTAGRRALGRLAGLVVLAVGAVSVLDPNALTRVAKLVGVGRGADLLLYVLAVTFLIVVVIVFRRLAELEERYVTLARRLAISEAERDLRGPADENGPEE